MTADLIAVAGTAVALLLAGVALWLNSQAQQRTGAKLEAAKVEAATAKAATAIAAAEVAAPKTDAELQDRLDSGEPI